MVARRPLEHEQRVGVDAFLQRLAIRDRGRQLDDVADAQIVEDPTVAVFGAGGTQDDREAACRDPSVLLQPGDGLEERYGVALLWIDYPRVQEAQRPARIGRAPGPQRAEVGL